MNDVLVHFDGHGFYVNSDSDESSGVETGGHIVFEDDAAEGGKAVSGAEFGALACECGLKVVVLNACRSAYEESRAQDDATPPAASFGRSLLSLELLVLMTPCYRSIAALTLTI